MNTSLISALKRNDRKYILAEVLELTGATEEIVQEVRDASRVTSALIDRVCSVAEEPKSEPEEVEYLEDDELSELAEALIALAELISKGKKKKAKKLYKHIGEEFNYTDSDLKKQIKEL